MSTVWSCVDIEAVARRRQESHHQYQESTASVAVVTVCCHGIDVYLLLFNMYFWLLPFIAMVKAKLHCLPTHFLKTDVNGGLMTH